MLQALQNLLFKQVSFWLCEFFAFFCMPETRLCWPSEIKKSRTNHAPKSWRPSSTFPPHISCEQLSPVGSGLWECRAYRACTHWPPQGWLACGCQGIHSATQNTVRYEHGSLNGTTKWKPKKQSQAKLEHNTRWNIELRLISCMRGKVALQVIKNH